MHTSPNRADSTVGGLGANIPPLPGQLELQPPEQSRRELENLLNGFRSWLDTEWRNNATHVRIDAVRSYFGWPRA